MVKKLLSRYNNLPKGVKASMWFVICAFMQKGITVIATPIFTRLLTTAEYGQFSTFSSWLTIVTAVVSLSLYYGVYTQGLVKFSEEKDIYSSSMQGLLITLVTGWTVVYLIFHNFFNRIFDLTTVQMLLMLMMIWTTGTFRLWATSKRVALEYRSLVVVTIIISLLKPGLGVVAVFLAQDKVFARILEIALVELAGYSWCFAYHMRCGKVFYSKKYWKYAIMLNIPLVPHYLSQTVLNSADRIMIKQMVGASEAGIYSLAYSVSRIMILFNTSIKQAVSPWIYRKIKERDVANLSQVSTPTVIIVALLNLLTIAFAPEVVAIFAPPKYYEAIWVIPPVAMGVYFMYLYPLFADFEFYYEKTAYISLATCAGAVINLILNYFCIQKFGYLAAGYTTLLCYMFYALFHYLFMRKICKKDFPGIDVYHDKELLAITGVFLLLGFVFMATYRHIIIRYSMIAVLAVVLMIKRKLVSQYIRSILTLRKNNKKQRGKKNTADADVISENAESKGTTNDRTDEE